MKGKTLTHLKNTTSHHGSSDIAPVLDAHETHGIVRESPVDVLYMKNGEKRFIRIKVWSKVKAGLFRFTDIACVGTRTEMQQKCGITAGIMAEQLCELYGDLVEPSECAKYAGKHFAELCDHLERQSAL